MSKSEDNRDTVESLQKRLADLEGRLMSAGEDYAEIQGQLDNLPDVEGHEARWLHEQLTALRGVVDMPWQLDAIDELRDWLNLQRGAV